MQNSENRPAGRLVPIFSEQTSGAATALTLALAKSAASQGETVLMLDLMDGKIMDAAGIIVGRTLGDVLYRQAKLRDAKYVSQNEHFTAACAGDARLEDLLGSIAALSLRYDWVFVGAPSGLTPAHTSLAAAADSSLLSYSVISDHFMRAYWMMDAIRARHPKFDPLVIAVGDEAQAFETFDLLSGTISEFLGAPPSLGGILETAHMAEALAPTLIASLREEPINYKSAVS